MTLKRDALTAAIRLIYEEDRISTDAAGELLLLTGEVGIYAHVSESEIDVMDQPDEWVDEMGHPWKMVVGHEWIDGEGRVWLWGGGFTWLEDVPGDKQPIMYRADRPRDEAALCRVIAVVGELKPRFATEET